MSEGQHNGCRVVINIIWIPGNTALGPYPMVSLLLKGGSGRGYFDERSGEGPLPFFFRQAEPQLLLFMRAGTLPGEGRSWAPY